MAKVLLVEDDNNLREIYEARLSAEGYDIASAADGEAALVSAKNEHPDLIISDVMMPKISGFEMLDILRNTPGLKETPVIMLTALGQVEDRTRGGSLGANRYLVKSQVTLEDIVRVAHELLEGPAPEDAVVAQDGVAPAAPTAPQAASAPAAAPTPAPAPVQPTIAPVAMAIAPEPVAIPATPTMSMPPAPVPPTAPAEPQQAAPVTPVTAAPVPPTPAPVPTPAQASAPSVSAVPVPTASAEPVTVPAPPTPAPEAVSTPSAVKAMEVAPEPVAAPEAEAPAAPSAPAVPEEPAADPTLTDGQLPEESLVESEEPEAPSGAAAAPLSSQAEHEVPATPQSSSTVPHKKVIRPVDSGPKVDINALYAEEEAREKQGIPMTTFQPTQTPESPVVDTPQPPQTPTNNKDFDPNNVTL